MRRVRYTDQEQILEGYLAVPASSVPTASVLMVPTWLNLNESTLLRAEALAQIGYVCLVADLFGAGVLPRPPQQPMDVVGPLLRNRALFRRRLFAALNALRAQPECHPRRVAAVGYCLGGCGALEMARAGADLRGVVSLHGILSSPLPAEAATIKAKVLALHGDDDPLVPIQDVLAFRDEMRAAEANWQLAVYGGARHSFTGEGVFGAATTEAGLHPQSDERSWIATLAFLAEVTQGEG